MIKKQTIEYKIVSIIGLAGEIQTEEIYKLRYGKEYIRKTIIGRDSRLEKKILDHINLNA